MSVALLVSRIHSEGGTVRRFSSVCGGLPAPESAFNGEPFGYKFSWSPAGVLAATRNDAQWLDGGEVRLSSRTLSGKGRMRWQKPCMKLHEAVSYRKPASPQQSVALPTTRLRA